MTVPALRLSGGVGKLSLVGAVIGMAALALGGNHIEAAIFALFVAGLARDHIVTSRKLEMRLIVIEAHAVGPGEGRVAVGALGTAVGPGELVAVRVIRAMAALTLGIGKAELKPVGRMGIAVAAEARNSLVGSLEFEPGLLIVPLQSESRGRPPFLGMAAGTIRPRGDIIEISPVVILVARHAVLIQRLRVGLPQRGRVEVHVDALRATLRVVAGGAGDPGVLPQQREAGTPVIEGLLRQGSQLVPARGRVTVLAGRPQLPLVHILVAAAALVELHIRILNYRLDCRRVQRLVAALALYIQMLAHQGKARIVVVKCVQVFPAGSLVTALASLVCKLFAVG